MKIRLGKKQKRAVLDINGNKIVVFPKGKEWYAEKFVEQFNKEYPTKLGSFEEIVENCPWYIKLWVDFKFKLIDIKYFIRRLLRTLKTLIKYHLYLKHSFINHFSSQILIKMTWTDKQLNDAAIVEKGVSRIEDAQIEKFVTIAREMNLYNDKSDLEFVKMVHDAFLNDSERKDFLIELVSA